MPKVLLSRRFRFLPLAGILLCCVPLAACGQKGDLYIPEAPAAETRSLEGR